MRTAESDILPSDSDTQECVSQFPGLLATFMGRDALSLAATVLEISEDDTVVLPVYTCQEVVRSFVGKCKTAFYDVEPDLTILPDKLQMALNDNRSAKMVLITNYFGFLQPYRNEIREICSQRRVCLLEDCAHSLLTTGSGETGDMSIYSFRKILPVRDGGALRLNGNWKSPATKFRHRLYSDTLSILAFGKSLLNIRSERFSRARIAGDSVPVVSTTKRDDRILPMSSFTRQAISRVSLTQVTAKRREDFQFRQEATARSREVTPVFGNLPQGVCPFGFVVRTKNRTALEAQARRQGIHLRAHWRLDRNLGSDCTTSHEISKEMLTLPLYPELSSRERHVLSALISAT